MSKIQEPSRPWKILHMDRVTILPPRGDRSYNSSIAMVDKFSKTPILLPFNKDNEALLIWNKLISWNDILTKIISERYPKFTSEPLNHLHQLFGTKLSFSTAYHPKTDRLAKKRFQTLEDMVRRSCAYGLELKNCDLLMHD
ncbi:hypothetical protein O181_068762 [Austropuccinia psidii MF-1]|uniref:Integrase catalytic domain-containing protein n=1 Tax=Austropuccinia psidii MF-1 TaxID=1389203 RepID=A0A9Q3I6L1_9BASI|nr:hypothetical protein [Austropuccinia psidii MF-1]